jgi:hypothetical protein
MPSRVAEPVRGAHALFLFHLSLLSWWAFVQLYYRVVPRFVKADPSFWMGVVSLGLIATALVVTTQFARGRRGTASETAARIAMALAVVDLIGETLQFAPRLGLPALMPSDKSTTELLVRGTWASCEFAMRIAMFVALWRAQADVDKRIVIAFFALIGVNILAAAISFLRSLGPFTEWGNALPLGALAVKVALPISLFWMAILVYLSRRAASGLHPAS